MAFTFTTVMAAPYYGRSTVFASMLDDLRDVVPTCDGEGCDRELADEAALVFESDAGERRAYDCPCGAVTVTVVRG